MRSLYASESEWAESGRAGVVCCERRSLPVIDCRLRLVYWSRICFGVVYQRNVYLNKSAQLEVNFIAAVLSVLLEYKWIDLYYMQIHCVICLG